MEALAFNIAENRKRLNITQKELGEKLNVTAQAVSKWEKGDSEPDAAAISQMCRIFGVSADELLGNEPPKAAAGEHLPAVEERVIVQPVKETIIERQVEQQIINGYCETCKKPVGPGEYEIVSSGSRVKHQHIYCKKCYAERRHGNALHEYAEHNKYNVLGIVIGILAALAVFGILLGVGLTNENMTTGFTVGLAAAFGICYFSFVMQMFWGGVVVDIFFLAFHSFRLPGVIFTLDLDGIFFLIVVKVLGAIFSVILSVLFFIFIGLIFAPLASLFILPFAAAARARETDKLKKDVESTAAEAAAHKA